MLLWQEVLSEEGTRCCTSTTRDLKTVTSRVEHEGLSFLTITLPTFAKDFEKSLEQGFVSHDQFKAFAFTGGLPRLLGGFLDLVFARKDGSLLEEPSVDAIRAIRQLTLMFAKISIECTSARVEAAMRGFIECEQQIRQSDKNLSEEDLESFQKVSGLLWADIFQKVDEDIYYGRIIPKHGPGATADKLFGNKKFNQHEWTERLDMVFSNEDYLIPHYRYLKDISMVKMLEPGKERPVRVISVPKTQKTPRIIAVEPTCMQYMQQGLAEAIVNAIERDDKRSWLVGFSDQEPNQVLAHDGSLSGKLATLDLSEASDRVSNQHVRKMLQNFPHLFAAVDATRSRKADVPGYGVQRLAKFASMGSALCFPIEALVFSTLIFMGIQDALKEPLTRNLITRYRGKVRVYGDDIIVPVEFVPFVVSRLENFGFRVNASKSFWNGSFRESCGKDYYAGNDVTVVKVRELIPTQRNNVKELVSTVSLRNQLYRAGLWKTAGYLDKVISDIIPFPVVTERSSLLGRISAIGIPSNYRKCSRLQVPLVKGYRVDSIAPKDHLEGYGALLKFFLKRGNEPFADREHLERYGRPKSVDIKLRWAPA